MWVCLWEDEYIHIDIYPYLLTFTQHIRNKILDNSNRGRKLSNMCIWDVKDIIFELSKKFYALKCQTEASYCLWYLWGLLKCLIPNLKGSNTKNANKHIFILFQGSRSWHCLLQYLRRYGWPLAGLSEKIRDYHDQVKQWITRTYWFLTGLILGMSGLRLKKRLFLSNIWNDLDKLIKVKQW